MSQILVVSNDRPGLEAMISMLDNAGYGTAGASTFEDATRLLAERSPDLVIADERLGAFNGLHVIMRARAARPEIGGIVTTPMEDLGLEADARSLNIQCMVTPRTPSDWLAPISRTLQLSRS